MGFDARSWGFDRILNSIKVCSGELWSSLKNIKWRIHFGKENHWRWNTSLFKKPDDVVYLKKKAILGRVGVCEKNH